MNIQTIPVPPLGTNCYILTHEEHCAVVDCGGGAELILHALAHGGAKKVEIWLTHGHFDHAGAAAAVQASTGAAVCIHASDAQMLESAEASHATRFGFPFTPVRATRLLHDGDTLSLGDLSFSVLHTPGHTPGSCAFYGEQILFSGDTLFQNSVGNFEPANKAVMQDSVQRLLRLPPETHVYPGHESDTTIGTELNNNPFARYEWMWG